MCRSCGFIGALRRNFLFSWPVEASGEPVIGIAAGVSRAASERRRDFETPLRDTNCTKRSFSCVNVNFFLAEIKSKSADLVSTTVE